MKSTSFTKLNDGWNAEPNAPDAQARTDGKDVILNFFVNAFIFPSFKEGDFAELRFKNAWRYRLGPTNDEGWNMGQCRFSGIAPAWGEFYEVAGDLKLDAAPPDWRGHPRALEWAANGPVSDRSKHFLFYLRDNTFECDADDWSFRVVENRPDY